MHCQGQALPAKLPEGGRAPVEVGDIFRAHGEVFRQHHVLTPDQRRAMRAIETCRTEVLGGHADVCLDCGFSRPSYNSCRNRHCPKCQFLKQAKWIDERMVRVLPTSYFHVVFTLPAALRPLCLHNRERLYNLLFATVSRTLLALGQDPERLGGQLGFTAVLHTWTRTLVYHPHLHCIVTGGGLSPDGERWVRAARGRYLFPVKVMAKLFRGKLLDGLKRLYTAGELDLGEDAAGFSHLLDQLYRQPWVVYAKRPFGGPRQVYQYLGRYTHRVAISNQRLLSFDGQTVGFHTKNGTTATLAVDEFIRRFLLHVLPYRFSKIRHFGLLAPCHVRDRLERARRLLAPNVPAPSLPAAGTWVERLIRLIGFDPTCCPRCGSVPLVRMPLDYAAGFTQPVLDTS